MTKPHIESVSVKRIAPLREIGTCNSCKCSAIIYYLWL